MAEFVILVNEQDEKLGLMEKMEAHEKGLLHRAFSVFVINSKNELCLQQRALHKYHSAGLWTNTCCSHQRDGESNLDAGNRRLMEEMGMTCDLKEVLSFIYRADFDNNLTEHELDHVMVGYSDKDPVINRDEVAAFKWVDIDEVASDISLNPNDYTAWFKIIFQKYYSSIQK